MGPFRFLASYSLVSAHEERPARLLAVASPCGMGRSRGHAAAEAGGSAPHVRSGTKLESLLGSNLADHTDSRNRADHTHAGGPGQSQWHTAPAAAALLAAWTAGPPGLATSKPVGPEQPELLLVHSVSSRLLLASSLSLNLNARGLTGTEAGGAWRPLAATMRPGRVQSCPACSKLARRWLSLLLAAARQLHAGPAPAVLL